MADQPACGAELLLVPRPKEPAPSRNIVIFTNTGVPGLAQERLRGSSTSMRSAVRRRHAVKFPRGEEGHADRTPQHCTTDPREEFRENRSPAGGSARAHAGVYAQALLNLATFEHHHRSSL